MRQAQKMRGFNILLGVERQRDIPPEGTVQIRRWEAVGVLGTPGSSPDWSRGFRVRHGRPEVGEIRLRGLYAPLWALTVIL